MRFTPFCREVDDIADEGGTRDDKMAGLAEWRREIDRVFTGAPQTPTGSCAERCRCAVLIWPAK